MAATVVNGLTAGYWAKSKPDDYKGQNLDKALKTYEGLAGKGITIPSNLIPKVPKPNVSEIEECITGLESAVTELHKGLAFLKQIGTALTGVQGAAAKAAADLEKQAKTKADDAKKKYEDAASTANSIGSLAASASKDYK